MTLLNDALSIVPIHQLINMKLRIPVYQRPYRWQISSTNTLFIDTFNAFQKRLDEYRLGSVILHKKGNEYFIVDGQQRLTTLSILLYCLNEHTSLLNEKYNGLSNNSIVQNLQFLMKKVEELSPQQQVAFKSYLLNSCTVVKLVTDNEQEAFQFFDSQNTRGKELAPHDLLKSYHLREMQKELVEQKIEIINRWENNNQRQLEDLFKDYLFPLIQWYKHRDGLGYSSEKIDAFKGIKSNSMHNYAIYHKASNLFIEQMRVNGGMELITNEPLNQFQLTQPLLAGKRFFQYALHYSKLLEVVQQKVNEFHNEGEIPSERSGDRYIKQLYENALLFFADRFGLNHLNEATMKQLYIWSYSLRLVMTAVYPQTINKYACGKHERINYGIDLFTQISEMKLPEQLDFIELQQVTEETVKENKEKYPEIWAFINKNGGIV